jgi:3-oxoacyl-[acyl-carrier protein] reductase
MDPRNKVALVTGGGTGLGRAISLALAREGAHVAVNYSRSTEDAEKTAADLRALGVNAMTVQADVSKSKQVDEMVAQVMKEFGRIDMLVNNAGTTRYIPMANLKGVTDEDWEHIMGVNVRGAFNCARAVADQMIARGYGKIVNTASDSGIAPTGSSIPYNTSKAALIMLTKCLATALAPCVQVNVIAPGWMPTRWVDNVLPPDLAEKMKTGQTKRLVEVEDPARAVIFLVTTDSMTGQTIVVNHGAVMH